MTETYDWNPNCPPIPPPTPHSQKVLVQFQVSGTSCGRGFTARFGMDAG